MRAGHPAAVAGVSVSPGAESDGVKTLGVIALVVATSLHAVSPEASLKSFLQAYLSADRDTTVTETFGPPISGGGQSCSRLSSRLDPQECGSAA